MSEKVNICKNIVVIAPFWKKLDHVGQYRVERMVRWLSDESYNVTIIWSGWKDSVAKTEKWSELEIRDPLRRFTKNVDVKKYLHPERIKNKLSFREIVKKIVFYFDNDLVWSLQLTTKAIVKNTCKDAHIIISSSPPESCHLASYLLSKKFALKLVVDMRDGWIDEPMRPNLDKFTLKKLIETKWESKILRVASTIFVTSSNWKKLLSERIARIDDKIKVLTNAYPKNFVTTTPQQYHHQLSGIMLLHSGRFRGTRQTNKMSVLLDPLFKVLNKTTNLSAQIILLGNLMQEELKELGNWDKQFSNISSDIVHKERIERKDMFNELKKANGLLLLAATKSFFPSKTFEYIKAAKPILAVTLKGSTIWEIGKDLPQMFLFDYTAKELDYVPIEKFLFACKTGNYNYKIPDEFSEEYLSKIFLSTIRQN